LSEYPPKVSEAVIELCVFNRRLEAPPWDPTVARSRCTVVARCTAPAGQPWGKVCSPQTLGPARSDGQQTGSGLQQL